MSKITLPSIFTIHVQGQGINGARSELMARSHQVIVDEPAERGGKDEAATPLETMLSSYLACLNVITHMAAKEMRIEVGKIEYKLAADLNSRGIFRQAEVNIPFPKIEITAALETSATNAQIEALKNDVGKRCPISVILREAGTDVIETWRAIPLMSGPDQGV